MADPDPTCSELEDALTLSPYEAFFKAVLGQVEYLVLLLRSRLPPSIAADSLEHRASALLLLCVAALAKRYSDLLVRFEAGEREVLMYVLLEHRCSGTAGAVRGAGTPLQVAI